MEKVAKIVLTIFILGCTLDQVSTRVALMNENIYESNPYAQALMDRGLWLVVDIILVVSLSALVLTANIILKASGIPHLEYIPYLVPLIVGAIRMGAGIHNILLCLSM